MILYTHQFHFKHNIQLINCSEVNDFANTQTMYGVTSAFGLILAFAICCSLKAWSITALTSKQKHSSQQIVHFAATENTVIH